MTTAEAIKKVIDTATAEVGYLEKKSDSNLDDKTANAGSGNYTKYWRDVAPAYQAQPWCAGFVSWVLMEVFGLSAAKELLKHWPYVYCPTLAQMTPPENLPQVGSIVIFDRNNEFTHTGIVTGVSENTITTVEGNASSALGVTPNGGSVVKKVYNIKDLPGTRYFMPEYNEFTAENPPIRVGEKYTLKENIYFRKSPSGAYMSYFDLTASARKKSTKSCKTKLKKGNTVQALEVRKTEDGNTWVRVVNGWICVIYKGKYRVK